MRKVDIYFLPKEFVLNVSKGYMCANIITSTFKVKNVLKQSIP